MGNIFLVGEKSDRTFVLTNPAVLSSDTASFPCSNAFDCPFPHVKHRPLHHIRVNLGNLPGYIGLQLVEGGRGRGL